MPPVNNGIPQYRGEIKNENTAYENIWGKKTDRKSEQENVLLRWNTVFSGSNIKLH